MSEFTRRNRPGTKRLVLLLFLTNAMTACGGGANSSNDAANDVTDIALGIGPATVALSGTITAAHSTDVDTDTSDPGAPWTPNNTALEAQAIGNPVALGGYVTDSEAGEEEGSLRLAGDPSDWFGAELVAGQSITLTVAEAADSDVDLFLYNETGTRLIDASINPGAVESLVAPAEGTYLIEVATDAGASNYRLNLSERPVPGSTAAGYRLSDEFVPGEIVMERKARAPVASAASSLASGIRTVSADVGRPVLAAVEPGVIRAQSVSSHSRRLGTIEDPHVRRKYQTLMAIKGLQGDGGIEYAGPNFRVTAQSIPNDPLYPVQWHYPMVDLPAAWDLTQGDGTVTVAVVDSGVLVDHPDLAGQLVQGYDFISDPVSAADGDGPDANPDDPGDGEGRYGGSFHGTHVAGTIAAATDNGIGAAGVAPGVKLMPVRVLGAGTSGTSYDILQGIRYAAGLPNDSGQIAAPVDVMNLSFGSSRACSSAEQRVIDAARENGVVIVTSAGNDSTDASDHAPANCAGVIAVGAVDRQGNRAHYSNFGATVDVTAPGGGERVDADQDGWTDTVLSLKGEIRGGIMTYTYDTASGTSMAAPHVSGVVALMRSVNPALSPAEIDDLLLAGELSDGSGLINAYSAVTAALRIGGIPLGARLTASAATLDFSAVYDRAELELTASGFGVLTLDHVSADASWLSVAPVDVNADDLGRYAVKVDRSGLAAGSYAGAVRFVSSSNTVEVNVSLEVAGAAETADAGHLHVTLTDAATGETVHRVEADVDGGIYGFVFPEVEPGRYRLAASTDMNDDGNLCDGGEMCGRHVFANGTEIIEVGATSLSGLDFTVGADDGAHRD